MARVKKNETALTLEEKLEQALVPDWEWPYKIPQNWCWVNLESVASLHNGDRGTNYPSKKDYVDIGIPFINAGAIQNNALDESEFNYITEGKFESLRAGKIKKGDILYCLRGSLGKTAVVESDTKGAISSSLCILRCNEAVLRKYIAYLLRSEVIRKQQEMAENGSAQPNLSAASVLKYMLPIPPFAEQQRIVNRIESLFAKLDEAKEKAQATLDSFETRKAAILHKAFTGELTANWRVDNHLDLESWKHEAFDDCLSQMQNGLAKRTGKNGAPFVVLRLANLTEDGFSTDDLRTIVLDEKEQTSYRLCPNDVLMIRVNGSKDNVGKQLLAGEQENWAFCDHIIRIRYRDNISPAYMVYFAKSNAYKLYVKDHIVSSAGQNTISRKGMADLSIPAPSFPEQVEIVRILDSFFKKEKKAKEASESVLEQIDLIKKAILSRAFRGELGTNDPTEESALELLKQILSGKATDSKSTKKPVSTTSIPVEIAAMLYSKLEKDIVKVFYQHSDTIASIDEILAVGKNKMGIISTLTNLEQRGIIVRHDQTNYCIKE